MLPNWDRVAGYATMDRCGVKTFGLAIGRGFLPMLQHMDLRRNNLRSEGMLLLATGVTLLVSQASSELKALALWNVFSSVVTLLVSHASG